MKPQDEILSELGQEVEAMKSELSTLKSEISEAEESMEDYSIRLWCNTDGGAFEFESYSQSSDFSVLIIEMDTEAGAVFNFELDEAA